MKGRPCITRAVSDSDPDQHGRVVTGVVVAVSGDACDVGVWDSEVGKL